MATKNKLTKKQIFSIPTLLPKMTVKDVAKKYNVSWQGIWYHIVKLRKHGVMVETQKKGSESKIYKKLK